MNLYTYMYFQKVKDYSILVVVIYFSNFLNQLFNQAFKNYVQNVLNFW